MFRVEIEGPAVEHEEIAPRQLALRGFDAADEVRAPGIAGEGREILSADGE